MNLVQRVQDILLKPQETWPVIAAEPTDAAALYKHYLLILSAIAPIASILGMSLVGVGAFGVHIPVSYTHRDTEFRHRGPGHRGGHGERGHGPRQGGPRGDAPKAPTN